MAKGEGQGLTLKVVEGLIAEAIKGLLTEEGAKKVIVLVIDEKLGELREALSALREQVNGITPLGEDDVRAILERKLDVAGFISRADLDEELGDLAGRLEGLQAAPPEGELVPGSIETVEAEKPAFDVAWLEGLRFRSSRLQKVKGEDGDTAKHVPTERPLLPSDVLSWSVKGGVVTLATADGQKYTVRA